MNEEMTKREGGGERKLRRAKPEALRIIHRLSQLVLLFVGGGEAGRREEGRGFPVCRTPY